VVVVVGACSSVLGPSTASSTLIRVSVLSPPELLPPDAAGERVSSREELEAVMGQASEADRITPW
jgi:hypothetical protein